MSRARSIHSKKKELQFRISLILHYNSLFYLNRIKNILNLESRKLLYFSHVHSHLIYCLPLLILANKTEFRKLLKLQKKALRIVDNKSYCFSTSSLFHDIGTLPIYNLMEKEIMKLLHQIRSYRKPTYLIEYFKEKVGPGYFLRQDFEFEIKFTRSAKLSKHPIISFPRIFNDFEHICKAISERSDFMRQLNKYYFQIQPVNKCEKPFCKICNFNRWKERQLSYLCPKTFPHFITYWMR